MNSCEWEDLCDIHLVRETGRHRREKERTCDRILLQGISNAVPSGRGISEYLDDG